MYGKINELVGKEVGNFRMIFFRREGGKGKGEKFFFFLDDFFLQGRAGRGR